MSKNGKKQGGIILKKYNKIIGLLLAVALLLPGMATKVSAAENDVTRLAGDNRIETSIKISKDAYANGSAAEVVLAGWEGKADALTGTYLASAKKAPLLFTRGGSLDTDLLEELERLGAKTVYALGGTTVISDSLVTALEAKGMKVERVSGDNRFATAEAAAKKVSATAKHVFLAYGWDELADALAVGPASAKEGMPILLTETNALRPETVTAMKNLGVEKVTILGGTAVVSKAIEDKLVADLGAANVTRVSGANRFATATAIAGKYFAGATKAIVANSNPEKNPDALVAGYFGALRNAPILLTPAAKLDAATATYLEKVNEAYIVGGATAVNATVATDVKTAITSKLAVVSVSAINAKTLKVEFNKAVDTDKAKIEVKRDTVKPSVKEVKFSEDKKSATVEFNANMLAGDYTVSVTGLSEKALTGSVKVEAEKLTAIEFLSDVAVIATNDIKLNVQAKNQYGEIINDKLATSNTNISVTASKGASGHTIDKDGVLVVKGNPGDFKADDKVVVTIVDSATGVTATKTVTVAKAAQVESIVLGELKTDDEELAKKPVNVANMDTDFAKYYIPVTIKDQYGNTLKAADLAGVNVLSSNENIVKVASPGQIVDVAKVGTVIKLAKPTAATHGTVVLTVVSAGTGKTASVSVKVLENAKTDVLTVSAPETTLKQSVKTELPFSAADQYGNALVSSSELGYTSGNGTTKLTFADGSTLTATGANLDYSVDYGNKNKVKLHVTPTAKNVVLTAVSATGKAQTLNLTAEATPEVATLGGLSKDIYTAIQKDQTQLIKLTDVIVKDQYGEDIALPAGFNLTFAAVDGTLDTVRLSATTLNSGTTSTTAKAAAKGTEAIQISLFDTVNSKTLDTVTVNLETVELKDITSFGFEEVGNIYTGTTFKYGNLTADYNKALTIFGKKGSTDVKVDQTLLKSTTITAPLTTTTITSIVQASNQVATNGEAKTATLTGVIAGANEPITVTQNVTYNDAKSVIKDVIVRKTSGAKATITDGAVVVPKASIAGKKIGPVGADLTFQFYAKDQYGVEAKELSYTVTNLKSSNADVTAVAVAANGNISVTDS